MEKVTIRCLDFNMSLVLYKQKYGTHYFSDTRNMIFFGDVIFSEI